MEKEKVSTGTWIRTIVLAVALFNQTLVMSGHNPLPFTDEQMTNGLTLAFTVGAAIWAWWKDNGFTENGIKAKNFKKKLDQGEVEFEGPKEVTEDSQIEVDNTDNFGGAK
ncbi:phage holin [Macrococcus brunensis]|uniref:phage holin n=1 Tax=Macrococcus brunensis TaxID=198483 RepID=UPI001EEFAB95|nr:phage holin [Macrococcus brunensis]ULG73230.1 phage holin [Macrococcus brunensis]